MVEGIVGLGIGVVPGVVVLVRLLGGMQTKSNWCKTTYVSEPVKKRGSAFNKVHANIENLYYVPVAVGEEA